jgi:hypothetical protein
MQRQPDATGPGNPGIPQLGDAAAASWPATSPRFGRALRRAGVRTDAMRIALAAEAATLVGVEDKLDLGRRAWRP